MSTQDTDLQQLVINVGTTAQIETAISGGTITADMLSVTTDGPDYATEQWVGQQGYITGITSSDVTTALGYTPYDSANPSGYQANVIETVKVNGSALTPSNKAVDVTVPTVNNSTITITQGGVTKGSFTLNQASGDTIALDAGGGSSYTAGTGIDITNNEISVTSPTLVNTAANVYNAIAIGDRGLSGGSSISIGNNTPFGSDTTSASSVIIGNSTTSGGAGNVLIGYFSQITRNYENAVCIGSISKLQNSGEIAIGYSVLNTGLYSIGIGYEAKGQASHAIAIGRGATAQGNHSIQIGYGTNTEASTFCVGFNNTNYKLLDGTTGKIPNERLNTDSTPTSASTNPITSGGVYTALSGYSNADLSNLTATGKSTSASYAMPSGSFTSLTLGASGASYTATDNGYFFMDGITTNAGGSAYIMANNMTIGDQNSLVSGPIWLIMPVKKGDVATVVYDSFTAFNFKFIKAQGDV